MDRRTSSPCRALSGHGRELAIRRERVDDKTVTQPQGPEVQGEPVGTGKTLTPAERKAYEKKTAKELDAFQEQIAELRVKGAAGASQQKRMISQVANNLQMQKLAAANQLTALEKAPESAWDQQKANLDNAMEGLRKAWKAAAEYVK